MAWPGLRGSTPSCNAISTLCKSQCCKAALNMAPRGTAHLIKLGCCHALHEVQRSIKRISVASTPLWICLGKNVVPCGMASQPMGTNLDRPCLFPLLSCCSRCLLGWCSESAERNAGSIQICGHNGRFTNSLAPQSSQHRSPTQGRRSHCVRETLAKRWGRLSARSTTLIFHLQLGTLSKHVVEFELALDCHMGKTADTK